MRRNLELAIVYFFESFFKKISKEVFLQDRADGGPKKLDNRNTLYLSVAGQQSVFNSLDNYLILTVNKCLGNLALGDKIIGRYSISYVKLLVEDLKKHLKVTCFNQIEVPNHISQELLNINSTNLCEPLFYKLRSDLYEIISICFLDEQRDDYIENIHNLLSRVFELNKDHPVA